MPWTTLPSSQVPSLLFTYLCSFMWEAWGLGVEGGGARIMGIGKTIKARAMLWLGFYKHELFKRIALINESVVIIFRLAGFEWSWGELIQQTNSTEENFVWAVFCKLLLSNWVLSWANCKTNGGWIFMLIQCSWSIKNKILLVERREFVICAKKYIFKLDLKLRIIVKSLLW